MEIRSFFPSRPLQTMPRKSDRVKTPDVQFGSSAPANFKSTFDAISKVVPLQHVVRFPQQGDMPGGDARHFKPDRSPHSWVTISLPVSDMPETLKQGYKDMYTGVKASAKPYFVEGLINDKGDFWVRTLPYPARADFSTYDDITKTALTKAIDNILLSAQKGQLNIQESVKPAPPPDAATRAQEEKHALEMGPIRVGKWFTP